MLNYLKNNKIFVFLMIVMSMSLIFLSVQLGGSNKKGSSKENSLEKRATEVSSFNITLTRQLDLRFQWNIALGDETIEKMEIFHGDTLLKNVSDIATYSIPFLESGYSTGNQEFTFKLTLENDKVVKKNAYIYINEAFGFNVIDSKQGTAKIILNASYYYDKEKPVSAPKVDITYNKNVSLPITFVSSSVVSETSRFIKVNSVYELDISNAIPGSYIVNATWRFNEFNVSYKTQHNFEIFEDR